MPTFGLLRYIFRSLHVLCYVELSTRKSTKHCVRCHSCSAHRLLSVSCVYQSSIRPLTPGSGPLQWVRAYAKWPTLLSTYRHKSDYHHQQLNTTLCLTPARGQCVGRILVWGRIEAPRVMGCGEGVSYLIFKWRILMHMSGSLF